MKISDYSHSAVLVSLPLKWNLWLRSWHCFDSLPLKWNIWLLSLHCFFSLTTVTAMFYFTIVKMKYWNTLTTLFFFAEYTHYAVLLQYYQMKISESTHYALLLSLLLKWNIWLRSLRCFSSLTTVTTLFYFTGIKMKYLTALTTLFCFIDYTHYAALLHYYLKEISDYAHYFVFLPWLHWLRWFISLVF